MLDVDERKVRQNPGISVITELMTGPAPMGPFNSCRKDFRFRMKWKESELVDIRKPTCENDVWRNNVDDRYTATSFPSAAGIDIVLLFLPSPLSVIRLLNAFSRTTHKRQRTRLSLNIYIPC